ncbi:hypothetical protein NC651_016773 [Populus alba x Populus x berolinensis]|nr:hypothetical protein NC651_016773 [Populus alba x Populus x berolinensis]
MTEKGLQLNKSYLIPLLAGKGRRRNFWFFFFFFFLLCTLPIVSLKTRNGETSIMLSCTFQKYYSPDLLHNIYSKLSSINIYSKHETEAMDLADWTYSFRTTTPYYRHLCLSLNKNHIT